jgi:putative transposase
MVRPAALRPVVEFLREQFAMKKRRACRLGGLARSTFYLRRRRTDTSELVAKPREHAAGRPRWGYRRLHVLLRREGHVVNHKKIYRLYRAEGPGSAAKEAQADGLRAARRPPAPDRPREQWTMDFTEDSLANGRRFRTLNVVDAFTRECLVIEVDFSLPGARVVRVLERLIELHGAPKVIRVDNGSDFMSRASWTAGPTSAWHQARLHSAREAHRERAHRELQRKVPGRVPERELVRQHRRHAGKVRGVQGRLQRGPPAQLARQPDAEGVHCSYDRTCSF